MPRIERSFKEQERPFEILVIDCLSTDKTLEIAERMGARIISEHDNNPCESWAKGILEAKGSIISVIGADDYLMPGALKTVRETFNSNFNSWVVGRCLVTKNGELYSASGDDPIDKKTMLVKNLVPCVSCFFTKDLYNRVSGVDTGLRCAQDYDLWMRFLRNGDMPKQIPDHLAVVDYHDGNYSMVHAKDMAEDVSFIKNKYRL